ncbi:MAG: hypothetical protein AAFX08_02600 [Pseudomonadota bacterium]
MATRKNTRSQDADSVKRSRVRFRKRNVDGAPEVITLKAETINVAPPRPTRPTRSHIAMDTPAADRMKSAAPAEHIGRPRAERPFAKTPEGPAAGYGQIAASAGAGRQRAGLRVDFVA